MCVRERETDRYTHTMEYYSAIKKRRNLAISNDMDGTRRYYAKRNKSIRERQLSYDLTDMWNLRNKAEDHRGREEKIRRNQRGRQIIRDS